MRNKIRENSELIIEALNKISEENDEERRLKSIIFTALASYNIGDIREFADFTGIYMPYLKRKIDKASMAIKRTLN